MIYKTSSAFPMQYQAVILQEKLFISFFSIRSYEMMSYRLSSADGFVYFSKLAHMSSFEHSLLKFYRCHTIWKRDGRISLTLETSEYFILRMVRLQGSKIYLYFSYPDINYSLFISFDKEEGRILPLLSTLLVRWKIVIHTLINILRVTYHRLIHCFWYLFDMFNYPN